MAKVSQTRAASQAMAAPTRSTTQSTNAAALAFSSAQPTFKKLNTEAARVANDRKKLIDSITDPSLRASVR